MKNKKQLQRISTILAAFIALAMFQFIGSGCGGSTVTITYLAGGASGTVPASHTVETPGSVTLRGHGNLTRTGYRFGGWSRNTNNLIYPAGTTINWSGTSSASIEMTAVWVSTGAAAQPTMGHSRQWFPTARVHMRPFVIDPRVASSTLWQTNMQRGLDAWSSSGANVSFITNSTSNNNVNVLPSPDPRGGWVTGQPSGSQLLQFNIVLNSTTIINHNTRHRTNLGDVITYVMVHELGHVVGLRDYPVNPHGLTTMMYGTMQSIPILEPGQLDRHHVNILYKTR